jgi:hypothetical protein
VVWFCALRTDVVIRNGFNSDSLKFAVVKAGVKFCTFVVRKKRFNRLTGVNSPGR